MEIINYSNYKFNKMEKYILEKSVVNTECTLYFLPCKEKWLKKMKLFKKFYVTSGPYLGNKLLTINTLIDNKDLLGIEELIFPERLVAVNDTICGFMMPYIDSVDLGSLLSDLNVPTERKIELLKEVGQILKKVETASKYVKNFYLNDIHENNFILEKETNKLLAVDLDSSSIGDNMPFPSKYLHFIGNKVEGQINKYQKNEDGIFIPDQNSELLCYNVMVLNMICNGQINILNINDFYCYLEYLKTIGFKHDLLDCFAKIYANCDNENPMEHLDTIPKQIGRADIKVFKYLHKKQKY
ncbi:MAG: hypothetical protein PHF21_02195 [Bacilli bacterium]|nr:hypothetical protein [Bacilli bacterium]